MPTQAEQIAELEAKSKDFTSQIDELKSQNQKLITENEALKVSNKTLLKEKNDLLGIPTPKDLTEIEKKYVEEILAKLLKFEEEENVVMGFPIDYGNLARQHKEMTGIEYQRQYNKFS